MSTFISAVHTAALHFSIEGTLLLALGLVLAYGLLSLFNPLLLGLARAALLVLKPRLSKEERLQRRQMRDAQMLSRMLNNLDGSPSHVAELRALAARA